MHNSLVLHLCINCHYMGGVEKSPQNSDRRENHQTSLLFITVCFTSVQNYTSVCQNYIGESTGILPLKYFCNPPPLPPIISKRISRPSTPLPIVDFIMRTLYKTPYITWGSFFAAQADQRVLTRTLLLYLGSTKMRGPEKFGVLRPLKLTENEP